MNKRYWNEYQKAIADDHYFYERSCIRQTFFPGSETTFLKIMKEELQKDIRDEANRKNCAGLSPQYLPHTITQHRIAVVSTQLHWQVVIVNDRQAHRGLQDLYILARLIAILRRPVYSNR